MSRLISWSDRVEYDINLDCDMARVSGFDENHHEHWMVVEAGRGYSQRRKEAVFALQESIEAGDEPGELKGENHE
jgi:hypothetical protein